MKKIQILLIEENRLLRDGIASMLKKQSDMNIVASVGSGEDILLMMGKHKLNILLLDLDLQSQNSLQIVKSSKQHFPEVKIIVMDLIPLQSDVLKFVEAGVSGFILKDAIVADFIKTIRSVYQGAQILPSHLIGSLFSQISEHETNGSKSTIIDESVRMTKREGQVMELISDGLTNKEIAQKLNLSVYTVKSHVHNILEKLALSTRVQIAKYTHIYDSKKNAIDVIPLISK
jgi:DNA-binding NarL/FixJ family response regulator